MKRSQRQAGRSRRLERGSVGASAAEVRSAVPLPVFGDAQVSFAWEDGTAAALAGKVMGASGPGGVMVRFGGLDWATRARLLALAGSRA